VAEDRNQALKKQLLKKKDEAVRRKVPLAPSEMVDDALARGGASLLRWLKGNFAVIQWVIIGAAALGIAYGVYDHYAAKRADRATDELLKAVQTEHGRVVTASSAAKSSEEETPDDKLPVFKSAEEKRDTALASYRKVTSSYPGTGAAILARLGEAGLLLDKRDWDGARSAYTEVKSSPLATADVSVRGRALEGLGLANEGKKDLEGALKSYRELENTDVRGLKELGMYQQARILVGREQPGDTDKAKELLKGARERLKSANGASASAGPFGEVHPFAFLETQVDDLLRRLDPAALAPTMPPPGAPGDVTSANSESLRRLQEQLMQRRQEQQREHPAPASAEGSP
jgi:hypothetical protein